MSKESEIFVPTKLELEFHKEKYIHIEVVGGITKKITIPFGIPIKINKNPVI